MWQIQAWSCTILFVLSIVIMVYILTSRLYFDLLKQLTKIHNSQEKNVQQLYYTPKCPNTYMYCITVCYKPFGPYPQGIEMGAEIIAWGLTKGAEVGSHLMHKVLLPLDNKHGVQYTISFTTHAQTSCAVPLEPSYHSSRHTVALSMRKSIVTVVCRVLKNSNKTSSQMNSRSRLTTRCKTTSARSRLSQVSGTHSSIYPCIHPPFHPPTNPFNHPSTHPSTHLSSIQFVCPPTLPFVHRILPPS